MPPDSGPGPAEVIAHNGRVATQDDHRPFALAVAIRDGRFLAVGTDQDMLECRGGRTRVIDVGGRTVIPGLNDSHLHLIHGGLSYKVLDVFEAVNRDVPFDGLRWFFDHAETITERNLERVRALGGGIAVQHRMAYEGEYFIDCGVAWAASLRVLTP